MAKILEVFEGTFTYSKPHQVSGDLISNPYDGFKIKTELGDILIGIKEEQHCCERFGYISTLDNIQNLVGLDLFSVEVVDQSYNKHKILPYCAEETGTIFVNITTNNGEFQFTVYNEHNGYYGHHAFVAYYGDMLKDSTI